MGIRQAPHIVSQACPVCRSEKFVAHPQLEADREIKALRVYCLNQNEGCVWIGELSSLLDYEVKPVQKCVKCDKCKEVVHFTNLTSHFATDCPCYCQYCEITAERELIGGEHKEKCHKFSLTCPNNCGQENIPRDAMDNHKMECPLEMIQCSQCDAKITRSSKEKHDDENKIEHFQMLCTDKFDSIFNELQTITVNIDSSKQEVVQIVKGLSNSNNNSRRTDLINKLKFIKSKFFLAMLCALLAILVMAIYTKYAEDTVDLSIVVDKELERNQNVTCNNVLAQTESKLQQAKSYQAKLENDIKTLMSMRYNQSLLKDTTKNEPTEKPINNGDQELLTELKKLNYLWSLSMNIYKSCKFLYDYMGTSITWNELLFLCNEMSSCGDEVTPVIVKMSNYSEKMKNKEQWYSSPFFVFEEGYKAQIRVDTAMHGDGNVTHDHVFVHLVLVDGPHDDKLIITHQLGEWPVKGIFTIELLNQFNDSKHRSNEVLFTCNAKTCGLKKAENYLDKGYLTPHETIHYQITSDYLQNNSLHFRISYMDTRYDYYFHCLSKYVLLPVVAVSSDLLIIFGFDKYVKIDPDSQPYFRAIIGILSWGILLVIGSVLVGNLMGGVLWTLSTGLLIGEIDEVIKSKRKRNADTSGLVIWYAGSFAGVLMYMLLVGVMSMPWDLVWLII